MTRQEAQSMSNAEAMGKAIALATARYQRMCREDYSGDWSGWRMYGYMKLRRYEARRSEAIGNKS